MGAYFIKIAYVIEPEVTVELLMQKMVNKTTSQQNRANKGFETQLCNYRQPFRRQN